MKVTQTFIVMRDEKGDFLEKFHNKDNRLAYRTEWTDGIMDALLIPEKYYERSKREFELLAQLFEAEPIRVHAEYTLTTLDSNEPAEPVKLSEEKFYVSF